MEAEKIAQDRAKQRAAREAQLQAQAQKANASAKAAAKSSDSKTSVNHLEIPAELAFIFSKLDGKEYSSTYTLITRLYKVMEYSMWTTESDCILQSSSERS